MFRRLRTKLTVLYAGLFGVALLLVSGCVYVAIVGSAKTAVRSELVAGGAVFDRLWTLHSQHLQDGAAVLSRDFGFRAAVATNDKPTIASALSNLKDRLSLDLAVLVGTDGRVIAADGPGLGAAANDIGARLQTDGEANGVFMLGDMPYQAISVPVLAPTPLGWLVFATKVDRTQMRSLESLSAIPLVASVVHRNAAGEWRGANGGNDADRSAVGRLIDSQIRAGTFAPAALSSSAGAAVALVKPLASIDAKHPAVLLLRYPLARALAAYQPLLTVVIGVGFCGLFLLMLGSWMLAKSVTRPISALAEAVQRLQRGESATVRVETQDEIGRLSHSFNAMATAIRERERDITHLALHDHSTGLPNRRALEEALDALIGQTVGGTVEGVVVAAALGVDRFNEVRGAIGYALANDLIAGVGARLREAHPDVALARLSSDTLGIALRAASAEAAERLLGALHEAMIAPLSLCDHKVDASLTAGLAAFGTHADTGDALIERASIAVDQARAIWRKTAFFDAVAYGDPASKLSLISEMLTALSNGVMSIAHQPKYDIRKQKVTGVEALVRWRHPGRGHLSPELFVGLAEETGHIRALTEWVLERAIDEQALMRLAGHDLLMSVNLSARLLNDPDFAGHAIRMIRGAGASICLEITETAVMDNPELALTLIDQFVDAGIGISIDDYGAGLSSLAYLKRIRADELKIDKSFILALSEGQKDALLVRSTIDLAHSLGLKVTAEGVETATAYALLAGMGCDIAQGYLIARPMPLQDLLGFLASVPEMAAAPKAKRA